MRYRLGASPGWSAPAATAESITTQPIDGNRGCDGRMQRVEQAKCRVGCDEPVTTGLPATGGILLASGEESTAALAVERRGRLPAVQAGSRSVNQPVAADGGTPFVAVYQAVCFPLLGIARVPRRRYFAMDRRKLAYLNGIEKLNCTYCSYANGLFAYVREVAGRTEQYWCPIKHARRVPAPHRQYKRYFEYGDAAAYRSGLTAMRDELRPAQMRSPKHATHRR